MKNVVYFCLSGCDAMLYRYPSSQSELKDPVASFCIHVLFLRHYAYVILVKTN